MIRTFMIAACLLALASTFQPRRKTKNEKIENFLDAELLGQKKFDQALAETKRSTGGGTTPNGGGDKLGYSTGSGLRSIAQGSADQANTAVQNQESAGHQAAYVAKNTLAQAANAASATAQAALAGKQIILQGLEQQARDAEQSLQQEQQQLQQAQRAAMAAQQSSLQAQHHVNVLTSALNIAQATSERAASAAAEASGELAAQVAMVGAAKLRLVQLNDQLIGVRVDFEATQDAAQKAMNAAQIAQVNANAAAAAAAASQPPPPPTPTAPPGHDDHPTPDMEMEMPPPRPHLQEVSAVEPYYNDYSF